MTVLLALASAASFGASVALQHREAAAAPASHALRARLVIRLARRPVWLAGIAASGAGFLLQAAALRHGSLVVVQPLLTSALVFALAFVAFSTRRALSRQEWIAVTAVVAGVAGVLALVGRQPSTAASASVTRWVMSSAIVAAGTALAARSSRAPYPRRRAVALGVAAGAANGYVAVLTKAVAAEAAGGIAAALHGWPVWALAAAAPPAVVLVQSVYQAGHLRLSLPVIAVLEPLVAVLLGVVLFREHVSLDGSRVLLLATAAFVTGCGLWSLATDPRLTQEAVHR